MNLTFENLRNNGRIDISKGIETGTIIKDEEELEGTRSKFWFNNYQYMFKEIFADSYEDYAELISSEIAKELQMDCAFYDLAVFQNNFGVITKNFVNEDAGEELISGTQVIYEVYQKHILPLHEISNKYLAIINSLNLGDDFSNIYKLELAKKQGLLKSILSLYSLLQVKSSDIFILNNDSIKGLRPDEIDKYLTKIHEIFMDLSQMYDSDFIQSKNGIIKANNLFDLWSVIDMYCKINNLNIKSSNEIIKKLADLFLYDIITSQGDRHSNNWGLIINKNDMSVRLSPIFDNSNMCNLNRSKAIKTISSLIESLNSEKLHNLKAERIKNRLEKAIYHERSSLKVIPDDVLNKSNNIKMISEFLDISSIEVRDYILEKVNKLSLESLLNIFSRIEQRIGIPIPRQIKEVVIKTIEININQILNFINHKEEKHNDK